MGVEYAQTEEDDNEYNLLQLEQGDVIRFGSVRFKIVELWIEY